MRFIKGGEALIGIPTTVGIQQFITKTSHYQVDLKKQTLELHYQLRTPDGGRALRIIKWKFRGGRKWMGRILFSLVIAAILFSADLFGFL